MNLKEQSIDIYLIWFLCWIYKKNWNRGSRLQDIWLKFIFEQKNLKLFCFVQLLLCIEEYEDDIWGQFHQLSKSSFCDCRSSKHKKQQSSYQSFLHLWDLHAQKLLVECWWNWPLIALLCWLMQNCFSIGCIAFPLGLQELKMTSFVLHSNMFKNLYYINQ